MSVITSNRRERNKQAVRNRIHKATARLLQSKGVEGVTVENICLKADVARMTFYNHYGSRHELLNELCCSKLLNPVADNVSQMIATQSTFQSQIRQLLKMAKEGFSSFGSLQRELMVYMIDNCSGEREEGGNQLDFFTDILERFFRHHQASIKTGLCLRFCAVTTVGAMTGILMNWLNFSEYNMEERLDTLAEFLVEGFVEDQPF